MNDVVQELDRWLDAYRRTHDVPADADTVQRARDEIVALRWALQDLEKENATIRALKDKA
jgi:hypothetical protein